MASIVGTTFTDSIESNDNDGVSQDSRTKDVFKKIIKYVLQFKKNIEEES